MTDFRALCDELVSAWDCAPDSEDSSGFERLKDSVEDIRAALAESAVGPGDEELEAMFGETLMRLPGDSLNKTAVEYARAVLARFGTTQPCSVPVSEQDGLHVKYLIHRSRDGSPIDFPAFVLRLDGKDAAAITAIRAYANDPACSPELAADLAPIASSTTQPRPPEGKSELPSDGFQPIHVPTHTCYEGDQIVNPEGLDAILQDFHDRIACLEAYRAEQLRKPSSRALP